MSKTYDDIPTALEALVQFIEHLRPEDIHLHLLTEQERTQVHDTPWGWIDFSGPSERFPEGMKKLTALLRATIFVVRDHQQLATAVGHLVHVAAAQQAQIEELQAELHDVRNERVALAAQKIATEVVDRLTDKGTAADHLEIHIQHREQESHDVRQQRTSTQDSQRRTDVRGKIGGIAKLVASLDAKVDVDTKEIERELQIAHETRSQTKYVDLTFKLAGIQPAQDPRAHAEAFLMRQGHDRFDASRPGTNLPRAAGTSGDLPVANAGDRDE